MATPPPPSIRDQAFLDACIDGIRTYTTEPGGPFEVKRTRVNGVNSLAFNSLGLSSTLGGLFEAELKLHPQQNVCYVTDTGEALSFAAARRQICSLAAGYSQVLGVVTGERVAICLRNCPEWCLSFLATVAAGAIAVPLNSLWQSRELAFGLQDSGSKVVVCDIERLQRLNLSELRSVTAVLVNGDESQRQSHVEHYKHLVRAGGAASDSWPHPKPAVTVDDDAVIMCMYCRA